MRLCLCVFFVSALLAACGGGGGTGEPVDITGGTDDGGTEDGGTDGGEPQPMGLTVDQDFDPSDNLTVNLPIGDDDHAQTFTAGLPGRLDSFELILSNPSGATGTLRVDLRTTTAGVPDENDNVVLAGMNLDVSTLSILPTFVKFDVTPFNISVMPGDELALVVRRIDGTPFVGALHGATLEQYDGGAAYLREPASMFAPSFDGDFGFLTRVFVGP